MKNTKLNLITGSLVDYKGGKYLLCQDIWYANDKYFAYIRSPETGKSFTVNVDEITPETINVGDTDHDCEMGINCHCDDCEKEHFVGL